MLRRLTNCRIIIIIIIISQYSHPCRFVYDAFPANALCDIVSLIKDLWLCAAYRMLRDQVPLHRFHPFSNYNNYNDSNLAGRCMARAVMSRGDQEQWVKFPTVIRWRLKVAQHNNSYKRAKEVMFSSTLLFIVCLFVVRIMLKLLNRFSQNSMERGTWPGKKGLDFGGNPNHVTFNTLVFQQHTTQ